jgi:glycosyltransferase involved in cell wall biosynthesis
MADRDRFEIALACQGRGPMLDEYRQAADDVWPLDAASMLGPSVAAELVRMMRRFRADVVHTHLWSADVLGGAAARAAGVPVCVATVHGAYFQRVDERGLRGARKACLSHVFRSTYALFDRVIAVSGQVAEDLSSRSGLKVPSSKISVIRNGVDLPRRAHADVPLTRAALGIAEQAPLVTMVANFAPMKGHRYLVAAAPKVLERWPDATFLLVGLGKELETIRHAVASAGLESRVRFAGARDDAVDIMALSDVVVLPSVAAEGIPISLIEALALRRPVVATHIGGIPEVIEHGATGLLVPPRDPRALAEAISRILSDRAGAARLADEGYRVAQSQFSAERMVREVEGLYGQLLTTKRRDVSAGAPLR